MRPEFIFGTVQLGLPYGIKAKSENVQDANRAPEKLLQKATALNLETLDTANDYGKSQKVIGASSVKSKFSIQSKFILNPSRSTVRENLEHALKELNLSKLEVFSFHRLDDAKVEKNLKELNQLKDEGLIAHTGVSIYSNEDLDYVLQHTDLEVIQLPFNLLDNWKIRGVSLEKAYRAGRQLHARSLYLQGLLLMEANKLPSQLAPLAPQLNRIHGMAQKAELELPEFCLAYAIAKKVFSGLVVGADSSEQLEGSYNAFKRALEVQSFDWQEVDALTVENRDLLNPSKWSGK